MEQEDMNCPDEANHRMNRRSFLECLTVSAGAWALSGCALPKDPTSRKLYHKKPNIILVLADDVGIEAFGCYGGSSYQTPMIDTLARTGVRFTHCYSQPLCTPSRVKLMTGVSNIRNYSNFGILRPEEMTFVPMLKREGYKTAVVGKWQLYGISKQAELAGTGTHPGHAGFDEYCLWQVDRLGSRYRDPVIEQNGTLLKNTHGKYGPDLFCDFIIDFMERHKDQPVFIYYPMALVHSPFEPTPESTDQDSDDEQANFADMMAYMDGILGRIVRGLDRLGLHENTLFLFTSDNGTNRKITSRWKGESVRGGKGLMTDSGTRVPLVVHWPAYAPGGSVCHDLVDFSDFLPTLAEAGHAPLPEGTVLEGRSFLPQIMGRRGDPREWIFCYYFPRPSRENTKEEYFSRNKRWKLYGDGRLFDLEIDPKEEHPILEESQSPEAGEIRKKLRAVIDCYLDSKKITE